MCNILESGKNVICLDPEHEYVDLTNNLGGCFIDLMSGEYIINPLEPKIWNDNSEKITDETNITPMTFNIHSKLSQHISMANCQVKCNTKIIQKV